MTMTATAPHVLHAAIDHPSWCEWSGLVRAIHTLTGATIFRCPGCWGEPSTDRSATQ
jgi:hypothetical protein